MRKENIDIQSDSLDAAIQRLAIVVNNKTDRAWSATFKSADINYTPWDKILSIDFTFEVEISQEPSL